MWNSRNSGDDKHTVMEQGKNWKQRETTTPTTTKHVASFYTPTTDLSCLGGGITSITSNNTPIIGIEEGNAHDRKKHYQQQNSSTKETDSRLRKNVILSNTTTTSSTRSDTKNHQTTNESYAVIGGFDTGSILEQYLNPSSTALLVTTQNSNIKGNQKDSENVTSRNLNSEPVKNEPTVVSCSTKTMKVVSSSDWKNEHSNTRNSMKFSGSSKNNSMNSSIGKELDNDQRRNTNLHSENGNNITNSTSTTGNSLGVISSTPALTFSSSSTTTQASDAAIANTTKIIAVEDIALDTKNNSTLDQSTNILLQGGNDFHDNTSSRQSSRWRMDRIEDSNFLVQSEALKGTRGIDDDSKGDIEDRDMYSVAHNDMCSLLSDGHDDLVVENKKNNNNEYQESRAQEVAPSSKWNSPSQKERIAAYLQRVPDDSSSDSNSASSEHSNDDTSLGNEDEAIDVTEVSHTPLLDDDDVDDNGGMVIIDSINDEQQQHDELFKGSKAFLDDNHQSAWENFLNGSSNTFPLHDDDDYVDLVTTTAGGSFDAATATDSSFQSLMFSKTNLDGMLSSSFNTSKLAEQDNILPSVVDFNSNDRRHDEMNHFNTSSLELSSTWNPLHNNDDKTEESQHAGEVTGQRNSTNSPFNTMHQERNKNLTTDQDSNSSSNQQWFSSTKVIIMNEGSNTTTTGHSSFEENTKDPLFKNLEMNEQDTSRAISSQSSNTDTEEKESSQTKATKETNTTIQFQQSFKAKMNAKFARKASLKESSSCYDPTQTVSTSSEITSSMLQRQANRRLDDQEKQNFLSDENDLFPSPSLPSKKSEKEGTATGNDDNKKSNLDAELTAALSPSILSPPLPKRRHRRANSTTTSSSSSSDGTGSLLSSSQQQLLQNYNNSSFDNPTTTTNALTGSYGSRSTLEQSSSSSCSPIPTVPKLPHTHKLSSSSLTSLKDFPLQVPQILSEDDDNDHWSSSSPQQQNNNERKLPTPASLRTRAKQMWHRKRASSGSAGGGNGNSGILLSRSKSETGSSTVEERSPSNENIESRDSWNNEQHQHEEDSKKAVQTVSNNKNATSKNIRRLSSSASPARAVVVDNGNDELTDRDNTKLETLFKKNTIGTAKAAIAAELTARKFEGLYGKSSTSHSASSDNRNNSTSMTSSQLGGGTSTSSFSFTEMEPPIDNDSSYYNSNTSNIPQHLYYLSPSHPAMMNFHDNVERDKDSICQWFYEIVLKRWNYFSEQKEALLHPDIMTLDNINTLICYVSEQSRVRLHLDQALKGNNNRIVGNKQDGSNTNNNKIPRAVLPAGGQYQHQQQQSHRSPYRINTSTASYYSKAASPAGSRISIATYTSGTSQHSLVAEWGSPMPQNGTSRRHGNDTEDTGIGTVDNSNAMSTLEQQEQQSEQQPLTSNTTEHLTRVTRIDSMTSTSEATVLPNPMHDTQWYVIKLVQCFLEWMVRLSLHTKVPCPAIVDALLLHVTSISSPNTSYTQGLRRTNLEEKDDSDNVYIIYHNILFASEDDYVVPILGFFKDACVESIKRRLSTTANSNSGKDESNDVLLPSNDNRSAVDNNFAFQQQQQQTGGNFIQRNLSPQRRIASIIKRQEEGSDNDTSNNNDNNLKNNSAHPRTYLHINIEQSNFILPKYFTPPPRTGGPSAAEMVLIYKQPHLLLHILSYIGCPGTLCRFKEVKSSFRRYIHRHQQRFFKEMVRVGGMSDEMRPKFWMWMTLVKCREAEGGDSSNINNNNNAEVVLDSGQQNSGGSIVENGVGGTRNENQHEYNDDDPYYLETPTDFVKSQSDYSNKSHNSDRVGAWQTRHYSFDPDHPDHHGWEGINGVPNGRQMVTNEKHTTTTSQNNDHPIMMYDPSNGQQYTGFHHSTDGNHMTPMPQWDHFARSFADSEIVQHTFTSGSGSRDSHHPDMMMTMTTLGGGGDQRDATITATAVDGQGMPIINPHEGPQGFISSSGHNDHSPPSSIHYHNPHPRDDFSLLEQIGREGKWQAVIARDVARAFGTLPPHKTEGNRKRDSVVLALAKLRRSASQGTSTTTATKTPTATNGGGGGSSSSHFSHGNASGHGTTPTSTSSRKSLTVPPTSCRSTSLRSIIEKSESSGVTTDDDTNDYDIRRNATTKTRQDEDIVNDDDDDLSSADSKSIPDSELVLSGVHAQGCKEELQNQLSAILHALAATYDEVGYCQGMDYLVCHLMRIMVDEIMNQSRSRRLPPVLAKYNGVQYSGETNLVEETVFLVMDTIFSYYSLRHMYWPELRCLKRTCKVFERLVERKLPVLADHFEHHDLNVGIFALGWFQTLFLYLPNMPSATVCHMWDIWFVERSFKIFFRAATAILFLSQPTLLNQEYDGMMVYLNTFPDSTLLAPDILMECALNIKVTNRMLVEIEQELLSEGLML